MVRVMSLESMRRMQCMALDMLKETDAIHAEMI